jgi:hypothetical protein
MIIKFCLGCKYHMIREEGRERTSYCARENCWSRFSRCIDTKALERFLKQESTDYDYSSSVAIRVSR